MPARRNIGRAKTARKSSPVTKNDTGKPKSYTDELSEWIQKNSSSARDAGLVAFLAVKDDVQAAIHAGFPVKSIWRHMRETGRTTARYETFLRYVRRYVDRESTPEPAPDPTPEPAQPQTGFHFDPKPKKEDLF